MRDKIKLELVNDSNSWALEAFEGLANKAISSTLSYLEYDPSKFEIAILTCDDEKIIELNSRFCNRNKITNVLSWPEKDLSPNTSGQLPARITISKPEVVFLGNMAITYQFTYIEAQEQDKFFYDHVYHLLIHSTLHLLGFSHDLELDAKIMEKIEVEILAKVLISDPYN